VRANKTEFVCVCLSVIRSLCATTFLSGSAWNLACGILITNRRSSGISERQSSPRARGQHAQIGKRNGSSERRRRDGGALVIAFIHPNYNRQQSYNTAVFTACIWKLPEPKFVVICWSQGHVSSKLSLIRQGISNMWENMTPTYRSRSMAQGQWLQTHYQ